MAQAVGVVGLVVLVVVAGVVGWRLITMNSTSAPVPGQPRCIATAAGNSVVLGLDQAVNASIIVGLSVRRGLAPRAASIAMATAYQESGVRNIDYGDRDSVGLFQQRPSQGWGTVQQILDPYYATGKFYDALVKIKGWQDGDINDVAQKVQVSGHPEAYRDHVADARIVASALTGESSAGISCLDRTGAAGDTRGLQRALSKTFGSVDDAREGTRLSITAQDENRRWAYASYAVANASRFGVIEVVTGDRRWRTDEFSVPAWEKADAPVGQNEVVVTVR